MKPIMSLYCTFLLLILFYTSNVIKAQPGALDLSFPSDAIFGDTVAMVTTAISDGRDYGYSVAVQPDGKILLAGHNDDSSGYEFAIVRYNVDGTLDATFDNDGIVTTDFASGYDEIRDMALQDDGKIVVAGFNNNAGNRKKAVARYNTDGSIDSTFSGDGMVMLNYGTGMTMAYSVAIQDDGKIVVAGFQDGGSTGYNFALSRLNPDGTLDNTFDSDGKVTTSFSNDDDVINDIVIQDDGKIVAVGSMRNGIYRDMAVVRYNTDGSLDNTFDSDGMLTLTPGTEDDFAQSVIIQQDGKVLIGGWSTLFFTVIRLDTVGALDNSFDTDGIASIDFTGTGQCYSILQQPDGKIVASGCQGPLFNNTFAVARFNEDGSIDNTFDADGKNIATFEYESFAFSSALLPNGKILLSGYMEGGMSNYSFALARFNSDGSLETLTAEGGKMTRTINDGQERAYELIVQPDNKMILVGREYTSDDDFAVMRLNPDGTLDETFDTNGIVLTDIYNDDEAFSAVLQPDGKIIVAGESKNFSNDYEIVLVRYNTDGTLDNTFDGDGIVTTLTNIHCMTIDVALQDDGKIVVVTPGGGDFFTYRYNSDGLLDTTFDTDGIVQTDMGSGFDYANSVAIQADGKIVVAGYARNPANSNYYDIAIVRYNSDGSLDNTFDGDGKLITSMAGGNDKANDVVIQPDGKILVAGGYGVDADFYILRYNEDGSLDNTFHADGKVFTDIGVSLAFSICLQPDGKILAAGIGDIDGTFDFTLLRYDSDGTIDNSFDDDGIVTTDFFGDDDYAYDVDILPNGKILLGGYAATWSHNDFAIARYMDKPAIQASGLLISDQTENTADISWKNGCGDKRVVFIKQGLADNFASPQHAVDYTANSTMGIGDQLDATGWYCVYKGTDSSVNVAGLSTFTGYQVQVCEFFEKPETFNTDTSTQNFVTFVTDGTPTVQASDIILSDYTDTSLTIAWNRGNGTKCITWVTQGTSGSSDPVNGTDYSADTHYGSGNERNGWYCVYIGEDSSAVITGLQPNTAYRFHVCEFMDYTTTKYLTDASTGNPANFTTDYAVPSTQASDIVCTNVQDDRFTLSWEKGNGSHSIVFLFEGPNGSALPVNNTPYTASTVFQDGQQIGGSGWYCVYSGTDTSVTITGLTVNVTYRAMVCSYNGTAGAEKYNTSTASGNPENFSTLFDPPTIQSKNITIDQGQGTATLNWFIGNGDKRAVFVTAVDMGNTPVPTNRTTYSADPEFGAGDQIGTTGWYCVYNGLGNDVTVTGLEPATHYRFMVCEYNGTAGAESYMTSTASLNPIDIYTPVDICIVTIDLETAKNMVIWEKTDDLAAAYYNVYKEITANNYQPIGTVLISELPVFVDTSSNPIVQADRYKITVIDTCGNESALSGYHQTIHLNINMAVGLGANLQWNHYIDEINGDAFGIQGTGLYYIYRGTGPDNIQLHHTISSSFVSWTDTDTNQLYYYRIGARKIDTCDPAGLLKTSAGPFSQSISNLEDNRLKGNEIDALNNNIHISVYPNPADEMLHIDIQPNTVSNLTIKILNSVNQAVYTNTLENIKTFSGTIDVSKWPSGLYLMQVMSDEGMKTVKLVVE